MRTHEEAREQNGKIKAGPDFLRASGDKSAFCQGIRRPDVSSSVLKNIENLVYHISLDFYFFY